MTAIIMVMWLWTAQIKSCHQAHQPTTGLAPTTGAGDPLPGITVTPAAHVMNTEIDLGSAALNSDPVTTAIGAAVTTIHVGVDQDHSTGLLTTTSHVIEAPAPTTATMIHPTAGIPLVGMSPKTTADLAINPENTTTNRPKDLHHLHTLHHGSLRTGNINRSQSMIHHQITIVQMTATVTMMMI